MRFRTLGVTCALFATLSGCSPFEKKEVTDCETALVSTLKSPSSFKAIRKESILISTKRTRYQHVEIEYDADNSYGAAIRDTHICVYPVDGTTVRVDIGRGDIGDALAGRGYFGTNAKLPTERDQEQKRRAEIDAIINAAENDR